ncbi:hypothetical protein [Streptacidiphilus jiangxiensis]|uniref:PknH-like extracellular domain-containing protein n=1 Tax=Streptacidiphilus jiangxiensis TaxID=235985 RepID=A0A1H7XMZ5_STRJI|nr:hypothetical protein [Streptacidiphilus jiangxiensis]SEM35150.1 hypothetical protein SAMN05414137_124126 [Streptacidiphilus jiangxiensis]
MRARTWRRRGRGFAAVVVSALAGALLAGCGGPPPGPVAVATRARPPIPAGSLRGLLLPATLPHGWTVRAAEADDAPGSPAGVTPPRGCQVLLGEDIVDDSATAAGSSASARVAGGHGTAGGTIPGTETVYAFSGQAARAAVAEMRALARRCAKQVSTDGTTTVFSVSPGPALGDESLVVQARQTYRAEPGLVRYANASVVRVGPFLVVLSTVPMPRADSEAVTALMPLAVARARSGSAHIPARH